MLDLKPGIDLQEKEIVAFGIIEKLNRPRRAIVSGAGQTYRRLHQSLAGCGWKSRRRGFFDHLLIASLQGTVALAQRHDLSRPIAKDLHLDMARLAHIALKKNAAVTEVASPETLNGRKGLGHSIGAFTDPHANAAAASSGLQDHRKTNPLRRRQGFRRVDQEVRARCKRHTLSLGQIAGGMF